MPTALILTASAASDNSPAWIFRGLPGLALSVRGSTLHGSIVHSSVVFRRSSSKTRPVKARANRLGQRRRETRRDPAGEAAGRTHPLRRAGGRALSLFFLHCRRVSAAAGARSAARTGACRSGMRPKVKRIVIELETPGELENNVSASPRRQRRRQEPDSRPSSPPGRREFLIGFLFRGDRRTIAHLHEPFAPLLGTCRREKHAPFWRSRIELASRDAERDEAKGRRSGVSEDD